MGNEDGSSFHTELTHKTTVEWVMIEDRVYDITGLRHPKGNYILKAIKNRDITREIHGQKPWRFENPEINYIKTSNHKHVSQTFRFLRNHCIGEVILPTVLMFKDEKRSELSETNSNLDLFEQNSTVFHGKKKSLISSSILS